MPGAAATGRSDTRALHSDIQQFPFIKNQTQPYLSYHSTAAKVVLAGEDEKHHSVNCDANPNRLFVIDRIPQEDQEETGREALALSWKVPYDPFPLSVPLPRLETDRGYS